MDRTAGPEPRVRLAAPETVEVSVPLPVDAQGAWSAVTARETVSQWLGALSDDLTPGGRLRLDFGDGDFFDIEVGALEPPRRLSLAWRFMGTSPLDTIDVRIDPNDGHGAVVTVTDSERGRSSDETRALGEGWRDFLWRLERWVATGQPTRYPWRTEVDVSTELPAPVEEAGRLLMVPNGRAPWMPLEGGRLVNGARLSLGDRRAPDPFPISDVAWLGLSGVSFGVEVPGVQPLTRCRIELVSRPTGALLAVHHTGWAELAAPDAERRALRARFASAWTDAVRTAQALVSAELG